MTSAVIPKEPRRKLRRPTIDEIISVYLAKFHHIHITPVSSNVAPGSATNALMGAIGPEALAANTVITQQSKSAQLQEWLHMKSFALSQPDFPDYRDRCFMKYEEAEIEYQQELAAYREQLQLPEVQQALYERRKQLFQVVAFLVSLATASIVFASIVEHLNRQRIVEPGVTQQLLNQ